jgi:hypothetical protein
MRDFSAAFRGLCVNKACRREFARNVGENLKAFRFLLDKRSWHD